MSDLDRVLFKQLLPYADVIVEVSDERGADALSDDGIWIYPVEPTRAAEGICAPNTLHEGTIRELLPQIKAVAAEIRARKAAGLKICEACLTDVQVTGGGVCVSCATDDGHGDVR